MKHIFFIIKLWLAALQDRGKMGNNILYTVLAAVTTALSYGVMQPVIFALIVKWFGPEFAEEIRALLVASLTGSGFVLSPRTAISRSLLEARIKAKQDGRDSE